MAQLSKAKKRTARLKRSNSLLRTNLKQTFRAYGRDRAILLAVLGQAGGRMMVTKGTIEQVTANMRGLDYAVEPSTIEGEFVVSLLTTVAPAVEWTGIVPDDTEVPASAECVINGNEDKAKELFNDGLAHVGEY